MEKLRAVLLGIAFFLPVFYLGCATPGSIAHGVQVVSVKLEDWKNPKDGETYVVALPTWKNEGDEALRQVFFVAGLKDTDFKAEDPKEPQFYGAIIEPGTEVTPTRIPEDGVVLGVREELEKKYGKIDVDKVEVQGIGSPEEYKPSTNTNA